MQNMLFSIDLDVQISKRDQIEISQLRANVYYL